MNINIFTDSLLPVKEDSSSSDQLDMMEEFGDTIRNTMTYDYTEE